MPVSQKELGRRLQIARKASRLTQANVARSLGVSRSTVAQIELGNRAVTGLELERLAFLFGRDLREFLAPEFSEEDGLVALFRIHPEVSEQEDVLNVLRGCLALGRELANLESLLGIDRDFGTAATYPIPMPSRKWDAIQQGQRIAEEERRRLGLGNAALPSLAEILETQGIRTAQIPLPSDVSGLTLVDPGFGSFVVVNRDHPSLRRRFSYAHEYCHVLLDRARRGAISSQDNRDDFLEVRANSFAANFLLPTEGVLNFLNSLGKGHPSRSEAEVFDEDDTVKVRDRASPASQDIQTYDLVQLAHYFKASRLSTIYRLRNLKLIGEKEMQKFLESEESGAGQRIEKILDLPDPETGADRNQFRRRFLGLGLEALRRGEISHSKLIELGAMVEVTSEDLERFLVETGLQDDREAEVLLPSD